MSRDLCICPGQHSLINQLREIEAAGPTVDQRCVATESISGSVGASQRPGFSKISGPLEEGDTLIVTKPCRLEQNAMDVRQTTMRVRDMMQQIKNAHMNSLLIIQPRPRPSNPSLTE
ncbi:recombinase family protein [Burkholderia multivorans]|nr:recombinase family protein [Burkholderia multivorans]